jgi:hypothetical protein
MRDEERLGVEQGDRAAFEAALANAKFEGYLAALTDERSLAERQGQDTAAIDKEIERAKEQGPMPLPASPVMLHAKQLVDGNQHSPHVVHGKPPNGNGNGADHHQ